DGRYVAYFAPLPVSAVSNGRRLAVWLRPVNKLQAKPLAGTETAAPVSLFWSPDSQHIGFADDSILKTVAIVGGPVQPLTEMDATGGTLVRGTWNQDGIILFSSSVIRRISADGGTSSPLTVLNAARNESFHSWPRFLPDGKHFIFFA